MATNLYGQGKNGVDGTIQYPKSPYSHLGNAQWGTYFEYHAPRTASVSDGVALTTNQAYTFQSAPYFWIWDIVVTVSATSAGTIAVDVYNAISGGASYLRYPIPITASLSAVTTFSARFGPTGNTSQYILANDPVFLTGGDRTIWAANYIRPQGTVFSVRAQTPASTGSITNLDVSILGFVSNVAQFTS